MKDAREDTKTEKGKKIRDSKSEKEVPSAAPSDGGDRTAVGRTPAVSSAAVCSPIHPSSTLVFPFFNLSSCRQVGQQIKLTPKKLLIQTRSYYD